MVALVGFESGLSGRGCKRVRLSMKMTQLVRFIQGVLGDQPRSPCLEEVENWCFVTGVRRCCWKEAAA